MGLGALRQWEESGPAPSEAASTVPPGRWQHRIDLAERALRGEKETLGPLRAEVRLFSEDEQLLDNPAAARAMSYFLSMLRALGRVAQGDYARAVGVVVDRVSGGRVPEEHRCAVHNRMATVLAELGFTARAREALESALRAASTPLETAYTLAQLAVLEADLKDWIPARRHADEAAHLAERAGPEEEWLDVRMRSTAVLLHAERRGAPRGDRRVEALAEALVDICGARIDRLGADHPRALQALVVMVSAQHTAADSRGDLDALERLTDGLAAAAQRSANLLGARHPQALSARAALTEARRVTALARQQGAHPTTRSHAPYTHR